jgi:hypothetical protein
LFCNQILALHLSVQLVLLVCLLEQPHNAQPALLLVNSDGILQHLQWSFTTELLGQTLGHLLTLLNLWLLLAVVEVADLETLLVVVAALVVLFIHLLALLTQ